MSDGDSKEESRKLSRESGAIRGLNGLVVDSVAPADDHEAHQM